MGDWKPKGSGSGRRYQKIGAWQAAMMLVGDVYRATAKWPKEEQFGLTNQVRRAATSIPSNIAEGQGRFGPREAFHHASIAHGSLCEVETQVLIAHMLSYIDDATLDQLMERTGEVGRQLQALMNGLRTAKSS